MSYCRWSCLGYRCDVYGYESENGFEVWIATARRPEGCPEYDWTTPEAMAASAEVRHAWLDDPANKSKPIGLPHDGKDYCLPTAGECAAKLRELQALGYIIPDYAIEELDEEAREVTP